MSSCQTYMGSQAYKDNFVNGNSSRYYSGMHCAIGPSDSGGSCKATAICMHYRDSRSPGYDASSGAYPFTGPVPPTCNAGQEVPPGSPVMADHTTGVTCDGANQCALAFNVGGANSGGYSLTGAACPSGTGAWSPTAIPPKQPDTSNADGGHTYCDTISGTCVTTHPGDSGAPASSDPASANNTTASHTDTSTGATSSDTTSTSTTTSTNTSTTTTTGTGTGGGGDGSGDSTGTTTGQGTSTTTGTNHTDTPASASSSATKCTTGICDVGNADGSMGTMYEASTDTPSSVYGDFKAAVATSPIISSAAGFFDASSVTGSCPSWHIPGNKYWGPSGFDFDFFCASAMLQILTLAGFLVLAVGSFSAFRIALY